MDTASPFVRCSGFVQNPYCYSTLAAQRPPPAAFRGPIEGATTAPKLPPPHMRRNGREEIVWSESPNCCKGAARKFENFRGRQMAKWPASAMLTNRRPVNSEIMRSPKPEPCVGGQQFFHLPQTSNCLTGLPAVDWPPEMKSKIEMWKEDHKTMFRWLIQRGYPPAFAQLLVTSAFRLEFDHPQLMGRVFRSSLEAVPVVWIGELPPRNYVNPTFSPKVFVGGVPWDIAECDLVNGFSRFGECHVEWPGHESRFPHPTDGNNRRPKAIGYVYIVFTREGSVKKLLQNCTREWGSAGEWYFKLSSRRTYSATEVRQVQIIPWVVSDSCCIADPTATLDSKRTVFVGALHGMMTSQVLSAIMNEVFGAVAYVGLDTDKHKYPIGSGRVTFSSSSSYFRAIADGFLEIRTSKFFKKIQIDPYVETSKCSQCEAAVGPYFCREKECFKYFCLPCWEVRHGPGGLYCSHKALVRKMKRSGYADEDVAQRTRSSSLQTQMLTDWKNAHPLLSAPSFSQYFDVCFGNLDTNVCSGSTSGSFSSNEPSLGDLVLHCTSLPLSCSSPKKPQGFGISCC